MKIDAPIDDLCNEISVAPQALRTALEASYKVEMREGVLTPSNISDGKQAMTQDGKAVAFEASAIKEAIA